MKESAVISDVCARMEEACKNIAGLSAGSEAYSYANPELCEMYKGMATDELEHVQALSLQLTELLVGKPKADNEDEGSAFFAGELNHVVNGDDEIEKTARKAI